MTLWANRSGKQITIGSSFGIGSAYHKYEITEDYASLKYFWHSLGERLKEAELVAQAEAEVNAAQAEAEAVQVDAEVVAFVEAGEAIAAETYREEEGLSGN